MSGLSVVILAGGYSTRMGRDKALLPLPNGLTLLTNTIQVVQPLTSEILVVTPWPERYQAVVPSNVQFVVEPMAEPAADGSDNPNHRPLIGPMGRAKLSPGPLSGFACGWQQASEDWCLLLACDMPHLETPVLQTWWAHILTQQEVGWPTLKHLPIASLTASVRAGRQGWEPLCGFYHRRGVSSLNYRLARGERSLQGWLAMNLIAPYTAAPAQMFFNCNMTTDWDAVWGRL